jgi:HD-GYP domain-containing protein (c-di-GMP phosphodiesterase class II)
VVVSHHVWWDGSGYPRRLAGADIPLGARVLAVVDAFESMTLGRAHRSPLSPEEARTEIERLKGRQFDPDVVEAFERALPRLEQHHAEPGDTKDVAPFHRGR